MIPLTNPHLSSLSMCMHALLRPGISATSKVTLACLVALLSGALLSCEPLHAQTDTSVAPPSDAAAAPTMQTGVPSAIPPVTQPVSPPQEAAPTDGQPAAEPVAAKPGVYTPNQVQNGQTATQTPVDSVLLRTPQVTTLNANADSIEYSDRHRGPFTLEAEVTGTFTSNLYNDFTDVQGGASGAYLDIALPIGYEFSRPETNLSLYFRGTFNTYPGNSELNHSSQILSAEYVHNTSERTTWDFSLAGGRVQSVEGYLPAVVEVGSTGVIQSNFSNGIMPLYNAAATVAMTHRLSERDIVSASATGGFMQQPYSGATADGAAVLYRDQTGGIDLQWQRSINPRRGFGLDLTNVYVNGLSPTGHSNFTSLQGTYKQALQQHWSLQIAAGPLYNQGQIVGATSTQGVSYLASGSLNYQTPYAHISGGYARVLQLGYLAAASPANEYFVLFDRPLSRKLDLTVYARDVRASAGGKLGTNYTNFGLSTRLNEQITRNLVFFVGGVFFQDSQTSTSISRNDALAGFTFTFGDLLARTGVR